MAFAGSSNGYGPDSVGVLGSARATNEENYLAQKFARVVLGTNNVDCCARVCHAPSAAALKAMLGAGASTNSFDDIERARTILVCGANATENHPIVGARIKQAALAGAHLIVIDPRRIELAEYAECHLAPRPGTNIPLLNAMAHTIVKEGCGTRISGSPSRGCRGVTPVDRALDAGACIGHLRCRCGSDSRGRSAVRLAQAVDEREWVGSDRARARHGDGDGADQSRAADRQPRQPGTGVNPLRGQNNVQGSAHMGCEPGS